MPIQHHTFYIWWFCIYVTMDHTLPLYCLSIEPLQFIDKSAFPSSSNHLHVKIEIQIKCWCSTIVQMLTTAITHEFLPCSFTFTHWLIFPISSSISIFSTHLSLTPETLTLTKVNKHSFTHGLLFHLNTWTVPHLRVVHDSSHSWFIGHLQGRNLMLLTAICICFVVKSWVLKPVVFFHKRYLASRWSVTVLPFFPTTYALEGLKGLL